MNAVSWDRMCKFGVAVGDGRGTEGLTEDWDSWDALPKVRYLSLRYTFFEITYVAPT